MRNSYAMTLMAAVCLLLASGLAQAGTAADSTRVPAPDRAFVEREAELQRSTASAIFNAEMRLAETRRELAEQQCAARSRRQPCILKAEVAYGSALDTALARLQQSQSIASHLEASISTD